MRQTLFRIWFERPWAFWTNLPDSPPYLGAAWVWLGVATVVILFAVLRKDHGLLRDRFSWMIWVGGLLVIGLFGQKFPITYLPVFGYGAMVLCGFVGGLLFSQHRARQIGMDPEIFVDLSFWLVVSGVIGARGAHLIQYGKEYFSNVQTPWQALITAVDLSGGGLTLIGGLAVGTLGFFAFCHFRKLNALMVADVITPAVFIGIGFGRIGCLLNGCCFGDRCDLPWGIVFPSGSTTFQTLVARGFVDPGAAGTFPLHPTQIYSSINGFILAFVTAQYFWYRTRTGDVFALGLILYPIARFMLEIIRADEMGQLGLGLTISQLYCIGIFTTGILLLIRLRMRPVERPPQMTAASHA